MSARAGSGKSGRSKGRPGAESAFRRLQERGEQLLEWFPELRKAEPGLESVLGQIRSLGGSVSRRAQETGRGIEAKAERLLADLEKQAVRGLRPLLSRANVASHSEIARIAARVQHLEERIGTLLEDRAHVTARVNDLGRQVDDVQAGVSERLHDMSTRVAASEDLRCELSVLHAHLDALSKDHVARGLELGKHDDRLVRAEVRLGDLQRDNGGRLVEHESLLRRVTAIGDALEETRRLAQQARDQATASLAAGNDAVARLVAVTDQRSTDRVEIGSLARNLEECIRTLRQIDLRLGDLTERQTAVREEAAALASRVSQLELITASRSTGPAISERSEGH